MHGDTGVVCECVPLSSVRGILKWLIRMADMGSCLHGRKCRTFPIKYIAGQHFDDALVLLTTVVELQSKFLKTLFSGRAHVNCFQLRVKRLLRNQC